MFSKTIFVMVFVLSTIWTPRGHSPTHSYELDSDRPWVYYDFGEEPRSRLPLDLAVIIHGNIHEVTAIHYIRGALLCIVDYVTPHLFSEEILHFYFSLSYLISYEEKTGTGMFVFLN